MGRVLQLLNRFCLVCWLLAPYLGLAQQNQNNVIPIQGSGAGLVNTATDNSIYLFTNKTFAYKGKLYSYPNTTTACIQELQQQLAQTDPSKPNSLSIKLAQNSIYPFSSQIFISNSCTIEGAGMEGSIFEYVGPTNLWTYSQVTNIWNQTGASVRHAESVGLFNFVTNNVIGAGNQSRWGVSPTYRGFSVWAPTNFPCYLTTFQCGNATLDHFGFFGPRVFSSGESGTMSPLAPVIGPSQQMVIASFMCPFQQMTVKDCWCQDMADGFDLFGNAYYSFDNNSFYDISCNTANFTNIYYPGSKLGVGYAFRLSADIWTSRIVNANTYNCKVGYYFDGGLNTKIKDTKDQSFIVNGGKMTVAVDFLNAGSGVFEASSDDVFGVVGAPQFGFITNGSGGFFHCAVGDAAYSAVYQSYLGSASIGFPMLVYGGPNSTTGGVIAAYDMGAPSSAVLSLGPTGLYGSSLSGPALYFKTNNTAAAGSLFSDPVGGVVYLRTNGAWFKLQINTVPGR